jgi:hypothetical protein
MIEAPELGREALKLDKPETWWFSIVMLVYLQNYS